MPEFGTMIVVSLQVARHESVALVITCKISLINWNLYPVCLVIKELPPARLLIQYISLSNHSISSPIHALRDEIEVALGTLSNVKTH